MSVVANTSLSHYRIVAKLGAGGMGEVWLAEDTRLKRKVALKLLPAELTADAERVRRFEQEAQAASALSHPNIITVYDIGECEAGRFIVMELVAGSTLRGVIAEDQSLETLLPLSQQMAKALSAAHAAGITHRDIKPDNIMVRDDGYVKVLDFGLARLRPATESDAEAATLAQQTTPGTVIGTVAYMSPEQARGEPVSHPSDIFALGIVLYELATGRHPFKAETLVGYLHAITLQEPAPLIKWKPELPAALNKLILRMLSKDSSQRPTASEVAQTLQDIERRGVTVKPQSNEDATMILPAAPTATARADEGFWVAVLPFKWRGASAELEALAEGLSEDIVTGLSRFSYLRVIARGSTLRFTSETSDVRAIGKQLGARYVMEGSLRQAGTKLRLTVQLIDATTGAHLWAENYERSFSPETVFELQDDLVPHIVSTVADQYGALVHSMSESLRGRSADQYSAHEAVLRAFSYLEHITSAEHGEVREILESAVAISPDHGDCQAMLANLYADEYVYGYNRGPDPLARAHAAAQRAVAAAPTSHLAHYVLATVLFFQKDFPAFRPVAERALALNRMDASTGAMLGVLIAYAGEWEHGLSVVKRAIQLNPHHPGWYHLPAFYDCYRRRDYSGALANALKINMPGWYWPQVTLAAVYGQLGEPQRARAALRELWALKPDFGARAREEFGKWFDAELTEHLIDGLRKAGLEIGEVRQTTTPPPEPEKKPSVIQSVSSPGQSIAVLPFANISADEENEYFCDGLAEELLNALAKIDELKVAARTSAFSFKGKNTEAREIGKTLNVNTVLEGSVRKAGNRIRISVQLVNAADGYHLWSERYDREMKDIFDIQDEITLAVVEALKVKLLGAKKAAVLKRYTDNTEAYQLYLKGRFQFSKWNEVGWRKAIEYFEQSLALEPQYAPAYAGMAESYGCLWYFGYDAGTEAIARQRAAVAKALEIDAELADAYCSQALLQMVVDWDFPAAGRNFARALALNPNDALAHAWRSTLLIATGHPEQAVTAARRVRALDPFSLASGFIVGWTLWFAQRYDEGISLAQALLEIDPHFAEAFRLLGSCHWALGNYAAAEEAQQKALTGGAGVLALANLCTVYARAGKTEEAQQIMRQLLEIREYSYVPAVSLASCYNHLDKIEEAFAWLEQALAERNSELIFLGAFPEHLLAPLCQDPRFSDLLRRIGLPTKKQQQTNEALEATTLLAPTTSGKQAGATWAASSTQRHTVGRERERNELRAAFNAANDGRGALLCVAGEPGIGKTTLVEDFLTELTTKHPCTIARGRCSERLAGTEAYLPLLEALESLLAADVGQVTNLPHKEKLKQLAPTWYAQVVPLAGDSEESARLLAEVKAASQERMKRELASFLQAVSEPQPLVIFFDDLHWADVSTIDLLSFLAGKFDAMRVLIVTTYRPSDMLLAKHPFLQIKPDLQARGVCRELSLEFLTEAEIADYLTLEFPRHAFPPDFAKLIHAKTEGSPLFMADLVRYLRDRNVIAQTSGAWKLEQTLPDIERELPESVRGMIERKIAQLSEDDRKLLTAASVQGYEFDSAVVAQVLNLEADEVEERLEKLERVFAFVKLTSEGEFPNRTLTLKYRFVHVLYQNTLYASLRITRKASLSAAVANALEAFYGEQTANIANELASLWEAAREYSRAADCYLSAAQQATAIFANQEAASLAQCGLDTLTKLPESPEHKQKELLLLLTLGASKAMSEGVAGKAVEAIYSRARALCQQAQDDSHFAEVLFGLWMFYHGRGNLRTACEVAEQLLRYGEQVHSAVAILCGRVCLGHSLGHLGELAQACDHLERGLTDRSPEQLRIVFSGWNLVLLGRNHWARLLWWRGYPDQALSLFQSCINLARETSHPQVLAYAHTFTATNYLFRRESHLAQQDAEIAIALCQKHGLVDVLGWAVLTQSAAVVQQESAEDVITPMREVLAAQHSFGTQIARPICLTWLAESLIRRGRPAEAHIALTEALQVANQTEERFYEAETLRLLGEISLQAEATGEKAEQYFQQAIELARKQQAKSLELRAAMSLARLWQQQGKLAEAQQMLAEIYDWFTEGFDTADLQEAKALLSEYNPEQSEL